MLQFFDRYQNKLIPDDVYADKFILFCYESRLGSFLLNFLFKRKWVNKLYGWYKNSFLSKSQIEKDIRDYKIDLSDYIVEDYQSYSDFFLREFKSDVRPFPKSYKEMGAFCEGRYLAFEKNDLSLIYPVKGKFISSRELLRGHPSFKTFEDGPLVIARLCPIDYHHFHFPVAGKLEKQFQIKGKYHSVNVHALRNHQTVFLENERIINILDCDEFGKLAYIEVGAMCVGKIKHEPLFDNQFLKGQRKGHFEFGASTVIILGEPGKWTPSEDLINYSKDNIESFVKLGDTIARLI